MNQTDNNFFDTKQMAIAATVCKGSKTHISYNAIAPSLSFMIWSALENVLCVE